MIPRTTFLGAPLILSEENKNGKAKTTPFESEPTTPIAPATHPTANSETENAPRKAGAQAVWLHVVHVNKKIDTTDKKNTKVVTIKMTITRFFVVPASIVMCSCN